MSAKIILSSLLLTSIFAGYPVGGLDQIGLPTTTSISVVSQQPGADIVVPTYPTANLNALKGTNPSKQSINTNIANVINGAQNLVSTPVQSVETLFTRVPSKAELTKIVDDGDIAAITKTIQTLSSDDSIPCADKVCYLQELLGLVKNSISKKSLAADQLESIVQNAQNQIQRLNSEIERVQEQRDNLNIPGLESNITDLVNKLQTIYDQTNAISNQIPPEQARILGYEKQLQTLTKQNDQERRRISGDELKLLETENLIKDLEEKLANARNVKNNLENSIARSQNLINSNNDKINTIRNTVAEINNKIKNLQSTFDRLKRDSNQLEVDLERVRTDLSVAKVRDDTLSSEISQLKAKIDKEEDKLDSQDDLRELRNLLSNLNNSLPQIQASIDREFYYCYGEGKIQTQTVGNTVVYVVRSEAFANYISNVYGQSIANPNIRGQDYKFQVVNNTLPVQTNKVNGSGGVSKTAEFSCLHTSPAVSGNGQIVSVNSNKLTVKQDTGANVTLNVGSCSRVESTKSAPTVGQNIAWKGSSNGNTYTFNVVSASCW